MTKIVARKLNETPQRKRRGAYTPTQINDILTRRAAGETLTSIAERHGSTRSYIKQLIVRHGAPEDVHTAPPFDPRAVAGEAQAWIDAHPNTTVPAIKEKFYLNDRSWSMLRPLLDLSRVVTRVGVPLHIYNQQSMLDALRRAFKASGAEELTSDVYEEFAVAGDPSVSRIATVFGFWTTACEQAGVPYANPIKNRVYYTSWDDNDLLAYVRRWLEDLPADERPTYRAYETWQATQDEAPSGSTVRNRLRHIGGFTDIVTRAAADLGSSVA